MTAESQWTVEALIGHASDHGYEVTKRQLESWRNQGLLPQQTRGAQRGLRPTWTSPPGSAEKLLRLLKLRETTTKNPEALLLSLWLRGEPQPPARVRAAMSSMLDDAERTIQREVDKVQQRRKRQGEGPCTSEEALREIARGVAAARVGDRLLPRLRSGSAHRLPGVTAMVLMFVTGRSPDDERESANDIERALGMLPRGRLDRLDPTLDPESTVGPWHNGQPLDLTLLARTVSLPAFRAALESASEDDLLYARWAVGPLTRRLQFFTRFVSAFHDDQQNFLGWGILRQTDSSADWPAFLLCAVLAMRQNEMRDNLEEVVEALAQAERVLREAVHRLMRVAPETRQKRLDKLGQKTARRMRQVVDEFAAKRSEL